MKLPSPITPFSFRGKKFLVKRDDLIDKEFSGNKARKFWHYFTLLKNNPQIKEIISYGSSQSNAMYSLSVLSKMFNINSRYYVKYLSQKLKTNPTGNLKKSIKNKLKIIENEKIIEKMKTNDYTPPKNSIFIKEGGANREAEEGIKMLAEELKEFKNYSIFLPSGTGTTALYLQKHFEGEVFTCSCVGDDNYLIKQWQMLEENESLYPTIIPKEKKFHFGKLYKENYLIWLELKKAGIEFDLLYDPIGWQTLLKNLNITGEKVIYIHQGGILGNESMIERYKRKYPDISMDYNI